jgi:hypothetical protein
MGNNLINDKTNYFLQCEPFSLIYFLPKIIEEQPDKSDKISIDKKSILKPESENLLRKKSIGNKKNYENRNAQILKKYNKKLISDESDNNNDENYYCFSKLIYKFNKYINNNNNLFIFDWHNTLFPTYYLSQENILEEKDLPSEYSKIFSLLEICVCKLLKKSLERGSVNIITNSSFGWVEYSANKYFPCLTKLFKYINIISAKNDYNNIYPNDKKMWKTKAFLSLKGKINLNLTANIICFGDSYIELEAGKYLASEIGNCFIKTIKFKEQPEPEDIIKQINFILSKFNYIYSRQKNLSIILE